MLHPLIRSLLIVFALFMLVTSVSAQVDDICAESGAMPGLDSPFAHVPYVYGRVMLKGFGPGAKMPKVTVILGDGSQSGDRLILEKSGNYCFKRKNNGGTLIVEVNGIEAARRNIASFGPAQQREDFEIYATGSQAPGPPAVISAKFSHPPNDKTVDLYKRAAEAEKVKDPGKAVGYLKEVVSIDPADFIAWAKLGSLYFEQNSLTEADMAFRKSLELRVDYTPAWINVGKMRVFQKQYPAAIEIFKQAISTDSESARSYQLLGQAYLLNKQGTLGAEALNHAIKLDPIGMAECHLQLARLYDLAGAKQLATKEYKQFLAKVPNHPDKAKFEKFIKDNPE